MTDTAVWITATVPVVAVLATTMINNRFTNRGRESQQKHDERLKEIEHDYEQRRVLRDLKLVAYSALLSEVRLTPRKQHHHFEAERLAGAKSAYFSADELVDAETRAKLLLHPSWRTQFDSAMDGYNKSGWKDALTTQKLLTDIFTNDLAA